MHTPKTLVRLVILIFIIFLLNYFAMRFYWYSSIWYFDMPMHFLGGVWLSFLYIYLFSPKDSFLKSLLKILSFVLLISIGWEVFEILIDILITGKLFNLLDTLSDLFFDLAGGSFSIFYSLNKIIEEKTIKKVTLEKLDGGV